MFGLSAEIVGIAVNNIRIKDGGISADLSAKTEADDARLLTPEEWRKAFLADAVRMFDGKFYELEHAARLEWSKYWERRRGIIRTHLDAEYSFGRVIDDAKERQKRNEKLAGMLAEQLGLFLSVDDVAEWSLGDRIKVRDYLAAQQVQDEEGPICELHMPTVLARAVPLQDGEAPNVVRWRGAETDIDMELAMLPADKDQPADESAA